MEYWSSGIIKNETKRSIFPSLQYSITPLLQVLKDLLFEGNTMGEHKKQDELQSVRAVVFDFDGTLAVLNIDFSFMRERVFDLMRHYGVEGDLIEERYVLEIIDEVTERLWEKDTSKASTFYQEAHHILHEIEMEAAGRGKLLPGVEGALTFLRGKGVSVGIVTRNCEDAVRKVFPEIDHYCDVFIARNSIKKVKPHPEHLTTTLKRLKVSGEESVMVGDHPIDIHAGKRVGMKTVGVLTGRMKRQDFEKAGADYILNEASEVCGLLAAEKWNDQKGGKRSTKFQAPNTK